MAYSASNPVDNQPLRTLAQVIRDNQDAVQALNDEPSYYLWSCHLADRTAKAFPSATPARIAESVQLFSKQSSTNNAELWFSDDQATPNVIQMTESGKLGSAGTPLVFSTIQPDISTGVVARNSAAICTASALIQANGSVTWSSSNISSVSVSSGTYTVTFAANAFSTTTGMSFSLAPILDSTTSSRSYSIRTVSTATLTYIFKNNADSPTNTAHYLMIFGGR